MKKYRNTESLERDLKILHLERKIAVEEFKNLKAQYKEDLKPLNWIQSGIQIFGKLGGVLLIKKFLNRK
ncbi:hypothetical protein FEZ18_05650 [Oceanihabitans sp. IOP_32]|uniref:hypothetical protein n=1 Tax=Oceanihabitans sp. IOP_32 TaxID=2529032 RepID=UPI0012932E2B|nr:hypothetical protein [Oceanihabitans sp. IOP_32]QFZ54307.1 hypothetical protein FEZ18_05650 [Oceanihabitans sp. IOP_32]